MTSASPTVFFVGAGVSFEQPSRVPMAIPVVEALVRTIAPSAQIAAELMPFLRAGRAGEFHASDYLRFEVLLEVLHDFVDPDLHVLGFIERFGNFNPLHQILAARALAGDSLVTTNFDALIERAVLALGGKPITLCAYEDFSATAPTLPSGHTPIFKLHGSLKRFEGASITATPETLGATIAAIAKGTDGRRLPEPKRSFFQNLVRGQAMLVAGYSGSDDLDIVPTFEELEPASILWLHHDDACDPPENVTAAEQARVGGLSDQQRSARDRMFHRYFSERPGVLTLLRTNTLRYFIRHFGAPAARPAPTSAPSWKWLTRFFSLWRRRFFADRCDRYAVIGEIWFRLSRMQRANALFKRAYGHLDRVNPPPSAAQIIITAARTREGVGDYRGASRLLQEVEKLGLSKIGRSDLARYWHERGYVEYQLRRLDFALRCFGRALKIALREPGQEDRMAYCYQDSGIVHQDLGRLAKADRRFARAAAVDETSGNLRHAAWARYQRGICRYYMADMKEAREQLNLAHEIAARLADLNHMGNVEHGLALVEFFGGQLASSIRRCRRSMHYTRATGQAAFVGMDWQQVGLCFREANKLSAARRCFDRAMKSYRDAQDTATPAELMALVALLELDDGKLDAARSSARRALRLARQSQMPEFQIRAEFTVGLVKWRDAKSEESLRAMATAIEAAERVQLRVLTLDFIYEVLRVGIRSLPIPRWTDHLRWTAKTYEALGNTKRRAAMPR
jgi:tetratricopeptide (TPR) repeat protein